MNADLVVNVAANDSVAAGLSKISNSVRLCGAEVDPQLCDLTTLVTEEGTFSVDVNTGLVTFTPVDGFFGPVPTISYSIADSSANRSIGTLSLNVQKPPEVQSLTSSALEGLTQSQTLTIPEGGSIALLNSQGNPVSELVVNGGRYSLDAATGVIQFFPNLEFTGVAEPASLQVTDIFGQTVTATYTPTVIQNPPPPAPDLTSDAFAGIQNLIVVGNVLSNDTVPANATIRLSTDVSSGQLILSGDGSFSYTPAPGFSGTVSFDYEVCHPAPNQSVCSVATATIVISEPIAPTAVADSVTGTESTVISGSVADNDTFQSGSSFSATTQPAHGFLQLQDSGSFDYTPTPGFVGTDSFSYQVCLPAPHQATCANSTVTLTVLAAVVTPQDPDVPEETTASETEDSQEPGPVGSAVPVANRSETSVGLPATLAMDSVVDATLKQCLVDEASNSCGASVTIAGVGIFSLTASGDVVFTPDWNFVGEAQIPMRTMRNDEIVSEQPIRVLVTAPESEQSASIRRDSQAEFISALPESSSTCLVKDAHASCQQVIELSSVGTWSISNSMVITFTPARGFVGESVIWLRLSVGSAVKFQRFTAIVSGKRPPVRLVLTHFRDGSPELTDSFKLRIEVFIKAHSDYRLMSCSGFTEGPTVLASDPKLAMARAVNTCDYAQLVISMLRGDEFETNEPRGFNQTTEASWRRRAVITLYD